MTLVPIDALGQGEATTLAERTKLTRAAQAWEALLLRDLLEPLASGLKGPARDVAMTAFSEALAEAGGTGLAESLIGEDSPSSSSTQLR